MPSEGFFSPSGLSTDSTHTHIHIKNIAKSAISDSWTEGKFAKWFAFNLII